VPGWNSDAKAGEKDGSHIFSAKLKKQMTQPWPFLDGYTVMGIGEKAFYNEPWVHEEGCILGSLPITSVTILESVVFISKNAFRSCDNIPYIYAE